MVHSYSIIYSIVRQYEEKEAIVLFVEAGEEVYQTKNAVHFSHDGCTRSKYMLEIPMIVWMSSSLPKQRPLW